MKNTFKNNRIVLWIALLLCSITTLSCYQWDDYKKYVKNGETIYTGKFDTAIIYSGKERVRLYGTLMTDPKIVSCKIFWNNNNNKKDSVEFQIDQTNNHYKFNQIFKLEEGVKSFTIFTYDAVGNSSVAVSAIGSSYGARYRSRLSNRKVKWIDYDVDRTIVYWDYIDRSLGPSQTEVRYNAATGDTLVVTSTAESSTTLKGFRFQTETFSYRTSFKPDPTSIDTFCTTTYNYRTIPTFTNRELDRSLFKATPLLGDVGQSGGSGGVAAMWDGKGNGYANSSFTDLSADQTVPSMITFNLGLRSNLTKIWILNFKDRDWYEYTSMKNFEIWGSATPSSSGALDASWQLLASETIKRPCTTCLVEDPSTPADIAAASAGFTIPLNQIPSRVQYIRIRCLQSFGRTGDQPKYVNMTAQSIGEIKLYGFLPK